MAEKKCTFDPLVAFMDFYADKKTTREKTDTSSLSVEERLKQRIIDGDRIGLDDDLAEAMKQYAPLEIINTFLLDGMKVVGELFGSGQMQLPFVLQSAETMKTAVAYLEPHMDKEEGQAKGTMVLATVKGDVHDIGKNLVDIILTNNGYNVINLGIKVPVETMLETAQKHKADAIGMSGLLVKSTLVMKENLQIMHDRDIAVPVVLGGAALTRRYVEEDLREIYGNNLVYAADAFDGLRFMERLANGEALDSPDTNGTSSSQEQDVIDAAEDIRKKREERGAVIIQPVVDEVQVEGLAEVMNVPKKSLLEADINELMAATLHERVIGGGRIRPLSDGVYELADISILPEQSKTAALPDLVRTMRNAIWSMNSNAQVFMLCNPDEKRRIQLFRALGFETVALDNDRASIAVDSIRTYQEAQGKGPILLISKPESAFSAKGKGASFDTSLHLQREQEQDADFPTAVEDYEPTANVHRLRITSDVARDVPVPEAPFYGSRIVQNIPIDKVYEYINEVALIRGQWQVKKGKRTAEEYRKELDEIVYPKLEELKLRAKREKLLEPSVIYGYYPCRTDYNTLIVYKPKGMSEEETIGEWNDVTLDEDHLEEWQRFDFPRQPHGRHLCISDFFRSVKSSEFDVVPFHIVTMGQRASDYTAELFAANDYSDYLYFHGLSVECAEALAEYWHKSIRIELGIAGDDAEDIRRLFSQGYRGSRYSFGYPACPDLEDQTQLFAMLKPERIGINLSEEYMLEPEQSTSAIIAHHSEAKYFNI